MAFPEPDLPVLTTIPAKMVKLDPEAMAVLYGNLWSPYDGDFVPRGLPAYTPTEPQPTRCGGTEA